ncbi:MAG: GNAT family N-acetyltransferase [Pseudomonadota bacterium]
MDGTIDLRPPRPAELGAIAALCFRSKAHWGYDADFMEQCREILKLDPRLVAAGLAQIATIRDQLCGVVEVSAVRKRAELELIFVDPAWMNHGVGRLLYDWAKVTAEAQGCTELHILSDPNARGFYEQQGAKFLRWAASDAIAGRMLPRLVHDLT